MATIFWISLFVLFYTYVGYGLLLLVYNHFFPRRRIIDEQFLPPVTVIVPAYNEENIIRNKIENCLQLHYPKENIHFVFVTDGSTDNTVEIIREYANVQLLYQAARSGKSAAINRAMQEIKTPLVVFTDANTMLHPTSIRNLVRYFIDPEVGGISGEKRIVDSVDSAVGLGEKIYWQYESRLKKANADFYTIIGAAGELFAIRSHLFSPVDEGAILDDFIISARICQLGYRFLYEEEAVAMETSSATLSEERKRKIRISAGCFQALAALPHLLNPAHNFRVFFQYLSHRVLRWVVCPLLLPLLFFTSGYLHLYNAGFIYSGFFWGQIGFCFLAFAGLMPGRKPINKLLLIPSYFVFMIRSQYTGFHRYITNKQTVFWEKAARKNFSEPSISEKV